MENTPTFLRKYVFPLRSRFFMHRGTGRAPERDWLIALLWLLLLFFLGAFFAVRLFANVMSESAVPERTLSVPVSNELPNSEEVERIFEFFDIRAERREALMKTPPSVPSPN